MAYRTCQPIARAPVDSSRSTTTLFHVENPREQSLLGFRTTPYPLTTLRFIARHLHDGFGSTTRILSGVGLDPDDRIFSRKPICLSTSTRPPTRPFTISDSTTFTLLSVQIRSFLTRSTTNKAFWKGWNDCSKKFQTPSLLVCQSC